MEKDTSPIEKFYEGQTIFITGGTGFLGKVMIEKLLTACPGIKKIYVLIRHKKGKNKSQRLAKTKEGKVFQALHEQHPKQLDKLEALEGDLELPGLGLSPADRELLKEVNVVLNLAATLNFNEELRKSLAVNVLATKTLLEICLTMKELKSFVHVSTAYANCDRDYTEERVYPSPVDLDELLRECEQCSSDQELEDLTKRALGKRPNTYTLTKAIAENVVEEYKTRIPIAIVRPSIVVAALRSPHPGWVDCRTGATGLIAVFGTGLLRIAIGDKDIILDIIPVDLVNNAIIAVAWKTALIGVEDFVVYNVTSGKSNPVQLRKLLEYVVVHSKETPQDTTVWYPAATVTTNRWLFNFTNFWVHLLPAYLHDILVQSSGKQSLVKLYSIVRKATQVLEVFMSSTFEFADDNVWRLHGEMTPQDRATFYCDIKELSRSYGLGSALVSVSELEFYINRLNKLNKKIDLAHKVKNKQQKPLWYQRTIEVAWSQYIGSFVLGVRRYLLGQADDTLPQAKERMQMFALKHKALKLAAAVAVYYLGITLTMPFLVHQ